MIQRIGVIKRRKKKKKKEKKRDQWKKNIKFIQKKKLNVFSEEENENDFE